LRENDPGGTLVPFRDLAPIFKHDVFRLPCLCSWPFQGVRCREIPTAFQSLNDHQLKQNSPSKFNDIGTEERKERKIAVDQFENRNATQN